jgi:DnaK suppressor protein
MASKGGKKISRQEIEHLREKLLERERMIFDRRGEFGASWANLHAPEIEFEEMAQKGVIAQAMDQLDDQERLEIRAIDQALRKIDSGLYGSCESCGREIAVKRLEAIPWTPYCSECAGGVESRRAGAQVEEEEEASTLPAEYQDLSDEEIEQVIMEELREDGRVELEELEVSCDAGVLYLEGALPSRKKHGILREILEETLGFQDIVDRVEIDPTLWEREEGAAEPREKDEPAEELALEGEEGDEDL